MSRIGKEPIVLPEGTEVRIEGSKIFVKGKKGELERELSTGIIAEVKDNSVIVKRRSDTKQDKALHGLMRSLVANMVIGVNNGYEKTLDLIGVGYRAIKKGNDLEVQVGYSKPVLFKQVEGIEFDTPSPNKIIVKGIDKELVGQVAADIRKIRKVEPYKGKGIRYTDEYVRRKVGKAGIT